MKAREKIFELMINYSKVSHIDANIVSFKYDPDTFEKMLSELASLESSLPRQESEVTEVNEWESIEEIIQNRISHFKEVYHKYEVIQLTNALTEIKRLVPPSYFKFQSSDQPKEQTTEKVNQELIKEYCNCTGELNISYVNHIAWCNHCRKRFLLK